MNTKVKVLALLMLVASSLGIAIWVMAPWFESVPQRAMCRMPDYSELKRSSADAVAFQNCVNYTAKLFLEKDYAEVKDLAKTFLTLLSAALVASITFSEKIVDIHNAKKTPLVAMFGCWLLLMLAIVFTSSGLASMALAAGLATYHPGADFWPLETHSLRLLILASIAFGSALASLIVAGAISLSDKRSAAAVGTMALATARSTGDALAYEECKSVADVA